MQALATVGSGPLAYCFSSWNPRMHSCFESLMLLNLRVPLGPCELLAGSCPLPAVPWL